MSLTIEIDPHNVCALEYSDVLSWAGGMIAQWALTCPKSSTLRDFVTEQYGQASSTCEMSPGAWIDDQCRYRYCDEDGEEDGPLSPIVAFTRGESESLYIYEYGICAFLSGNEKPYFARLD